MLADRIAQEKKKKPPEANASTQKRSKSKKKQPEANTRTQKPTTTHISETTRQN